MQDLHLPAILSPPGELKEKLGAVGMVALLFLLVYQQRNFDQAGAAAATGMIVSLLLLLQVGKRGVYVTREVVFPFIVFICIATVASLNSQVPETSLLFTVQHMGLLAVFVLGFHLSVRSKEFLNWFAFTLFLLGLVLATGYLIGGLFDGSFTAGRRFNGPFNWYNQMGGFLNYLLFLSLTLLVAADRKKVFYWGGAVVLLTLMLLLTYSRASWLSFFIAVIPILLLRRRDILTKYRVHIVAGLALCTLFLLLWQDNPIAERISSTFHELRSDTRTVSGSLRLSVYRGALNMVQDYPLLGVGPGAFGEAFRAYQSEPWLYARAAHNHFLQITAETGIIGAAAYLGIFLGIGFLTVKYSRSFTNNFARGDRRSVLVIALASSLVAAIVHNLFDVDWTWASLAYLFWMTAGVFVGSLYPSNEDAAVVRRQSDVFILSGFIVVLLVLSVWLWRLNSSLESGRQAFAGGNLVVSEQKFSRAVQIFPSASTAHLFIGRIHQQNGEFNTALSSYQQAAMLNPYSAEPLYRQGVVLVAMEKYDEAINQLREAVALNPFAQPNYYQALAELYLMTGNTPAAVATLEKAIDRAFPLNVAYQGFAYLYEFSGFNRKLANLYYLHGKILVETGDRARAFQLANTALEKVDSSHDGLKQIRDSVEEK